MPIQVYRCPKHGEFERTVLITKDVPRTAPCPAWVIVGVLGEQQEYTLCREDSPWVPSAPNFIGGPTTGAGNK